jgi:hypothetical protein
MGISRSPSYIKWSSSLPRPTRILSVLGLSHGGPVGIFSRRRSGPNIGRRHCGSISLVISEHDGSFFGSSEIQDAFGRMIRPPSPRGITVFLSKVAGSSAAINALPHWVEDVEWVSKRPQEEFSEQETAERADAALRRAPQHPHLCRLPFGSPPGRSSADRPPHRRPRASRSSGCWHGWVGGDGPCCGWRCCGWRCWRWRRAW